MDFQGSRELEPLAIRDSRARRVRVASQDGQDEVDGVVRQDTAGAVVTRVTNPE